MSDSEFVQGAIITLMTGIIVISFTSIALVGLNYRREDISESVDVVVESESVIEGTEEIKTEKESISVEEVEVIEETVVETSIESIYETDEFGYLKLK